MIMSVPERNNNSDLIKLKRNELSLGKDQAGACPDIGKPRAFEIVQKIKFSISSISRTLMLDFQKVLNHSTLLFLKAQKLKKKIIMQWFFSSRGGCDQPLRNDRFCCNLRYSPM